MEGRQMPNSTQVYTNRQSIDYLLAVAEQEMALDEEKDKAKLASVNNLIDSLREKDRVRRLARADAARLLRPRFASLHFAIPAAGTGSSGLDADTPTEDFHVLYTQANHNINPGGGNGWGGLDANTVTFTLRRTDEGRVWFSTRAD